MTLLKNLVLILSRFLRALAKKRSIALTLLRATTPALLIAGVVASF